MPKSRPIEAWQSKYLNQVTQGDCLDVMNDTPDNSIDLIYIDPPFDSKRNYMIGDKVAFTDKWDGGYLDMLRTRLTKMREILSEKGSIYVHLDWHVSHYVKVMMDEIFGRNNFRNEIAWRRGNANTDTSSNQYSRNNDYILFYSKGGYCTFNRQFKPYSENTLKMYKYKDDKGVYRRQELRNYTEKSREAFKDAGKLIEDKGKQYLKQYLSDKDGVSLDSIWEDIPSLQGNGKERLNYPTQKPEKLLERIIKVSSNEGDIVADFFGGSGTTAFVAQKLGRKFITTDIGDDACEIMKKRLKV